MTLIVLNPQQPAEPGDTQTAASLSDIRGAVLGLLDNGKAGTTRFYDFLEEILRRDHGVTEFVRSA